MTIDTQKLFILNRKGQKICVILEQTPNQQGLAFVMHGLSGYKEQPHVETIAQAFRDNNFTVVRFDTTNTFGESDGNFEDATTTNYFEDLEDVINWTKSQQFFQEPFYLAGHSLGGISIALFAQKHPELVKGLAPVSTVVSGKLSLEKYTPEQLADWKAKGWIIKNSGLSKFGTPKKIKWQEMEDRLKYDLLKKAHKLIMPVLMIVGSEDHSTPEKHQRLLYEKLPGKKEIHVIQNAPHTFKDPGHLKEIKNIFNNWVQKYN